MFSPKFALELASEFKRFRRWTRLQGLASSPDLASIELLAMAQAENTLFEAARETAEKALAIAEQQRDRRTIARLQQQLRWIAQRKKPSELK